MASRVAIITGGAKGIGRGIGLRLAEDGWAVALCFRRGAAEADETAHALEAKGARALACRCDVSDPQACQAFVERVGGEFGRIDALINGAGPYRRMPLLAESDGRRGRAILHEWRHLSARGLELGCSLENAERPQRR